MATRNSETVLPTDAELRERYETGIVSNRSPKMMHVPTNPDAGKNDVETECGLPDTRCYRQSNPNPDSRHVTLTRKVVAVYPPGYLAEGWCQKCKRVVVGLPSVQGAKEHNNDYWIDAFFDLE